MDFKIELEAKKPTDDSKAWRWRLINPYDCQATDARGDADTINEAIEAAARARLATLQGQQKFHAAQLYETRTAIESLATLKLY